MRLAAAICGVLALGCVATAGFVSRHELRYSVELHRDGTCVGCHAANHPGLVADWKASPHFTAGVSCADCHGESHEAVIAARGAVDAAVCARCHADAARSFATSAHAHAQDGIEKTSLFQAAPEAVQRAACAPCHDIGRPGSDGFRGRCADCHGGHRFSAAAARSPEACTPCHDGPDRPETAAWRESPHGAQYRQFGPGQAPACADCHMGGAGGHGDTPILTLSHGRQGTVLEGELAVPPSPTLSRAEFATRRAATIALCRRCHAQDLAERSLAEADAVKREADRPLSEAAELVRRLFADGLLRPMPQERRPDPVAGHALAPGESYTETSAIEQRFFELSRMAHAATVRGAYHQAPGVLHWQGFAAEQAALTFIRDEARRLRAAAGPAVAPTVRTAP